ncbi:hypothetical protein [Olleya marilimosa]|uniref:hypothetical protein n=1 Tax=Olleya marilimosa TaxID=272164 RepID=UPI0012FA9001|nr:hypothetical protein [Olleya marilimosa]
MESDETLVNKIESELKSDKLDFSELNDFEWDKLLILEPYSMIKPIGDSLKLDLKNISENQIGFRESINVLVFIKNGKSIKIAEILRKNIEFEQLNSFIKKNDAQFFRTENGNFKLIDENNRNLLKRINGIPKSSFWAGNNEKGNWFFIKSINNHKNNAQISIYEDKTGDIILESRFMKICPTNELNFIENLKEEIDFYDGEKIQLKDNCYLQKN